MKKKTKKKLNQIHLQLMKLEWLCQPIDWDAVERYLAANPPYLHTLRDIRKNEIERQKINTNV